MKKILFISHDASRTGAPLLLLNLLKIIKERLNYKILIIIRVGRGPLMNEFEKYGEVVVWKKAIKSKNTSRIKMNIDSYSTKQKIKKWVSSSECIFSNTITNGEVLEFIKQQSSSVSIISYIHELELGISQFTDAENLKKTLIYTSLFAVPSEAVKNCLVNSLKIDERKIFSLNYFIPFNNNNSDVRSSLIEKQNKFIVGAAGTTDWRKGPDLFIATAKFFFDAYADTNVLFLWKGGSKNEIDSKRFVYEIEKSGLTDKIIYEETSGNTASFYKKIDLFFLSSKEDPYPLVVLEAADFQKPSICFDGAGGAAEFVSEDCGKIVAFYDIAAAAKAILWLMKNHEIRKQKGIAASDKLKKIHQDKDLIISQFNIFLLKIGVA